VFETCKTRGRYGSTYDGGLHGRTKRTTGEQGVINNKLKGIKCLPGFLCDNEDRTMAPTSISTAVPENNRHLGVLPLLEMREDRVHGWNQH
jgi:hypothetical protein